MKTNALTTETRAGTGIPPTTWAKPKHTKIPDKHMNKNFQKKFPKSFSETPMNPREIPFQFI